MYTQGDWKIGIPDINSGVVKIFAGDLLIASIEPVDCMKGLRLQDNIDNANLIAAAPTLLFELKCILKRFDIEVEQNPSKSFPGRSHMEDIRTAIKKAEGKS